MLMARRPFLIYILVVYPLSLAIGVCPSCNSFYYRGLGLIQGTRHFTTHFTTGLWEVILSRRMASRPMPRRALADSGGGQGQGPAVSHAAAERAGLRPVLYAISSAMPGANCIMVFKALSGLLHTYIHDRPTPTPTPTPTPPTPTPTPTPNPIPTPIYALTPEAAGSWLLMTSSSEADTKLVPHAVFAWGASPPPLGAQHGKVLWAIVLVFLVGMLHMVFWLHRLNAALRRYQALFIIPLFQASWIIFTVVSGGIFFGEFLELAPRQIVGTSLIPIYPH